MQISGINKFSLIEYPGHISCVIFTPGCNLRCLFCHNDEFVLPQKLNLILGHLITEEAFFKFLETRKGVLNGVSICGGEPTLQNDLKNFCKRIKDMGFLVKIDTNGRSPELISELIEESLVDYIAMDIKHEPGKFNELVGVKIDESKYLKSIELLLNSNIDYEFRTTIIKGVHNKETIENISKFIAGAKNYYLQNYRKEKTLDPNFIGEKFSKEELKELYKIGKKYINNMGIRN